MFTPAGYNWEVTVRVAPAYEPRRNWGPEVPNDVTIEHMTSYLFDNKVRYYSEVSWKVPCNRSSPAYDLAFSNESDWMAFILMFSDNVIRKVDVTAPL